MTRFCNKAVLNLILAIFLITAQSLAAAHEFEHDTGNSQNPICTTCVAASQLGSACIDSHMYFQIADLEFAAPSTRVTGFISTHALAVRQRGPPSSI
jgi:hypothetical protein